MATHLRAQALVAASGWEVDKNERLVDFIQHPTLGLMGISVVNHRMTRGSSPSAIHLWNWDKNLGLVSKKEYQFTCEEEDHFDFIGKYEDAQSGGWYFARDHFAKRSNTKRVLELSIVKFTFDGRVEQSKTYPLFDAEDKQGSVISQMYNAGEINGRNRFQSTSRNGKYILLSNVFLPGTANFLILDNMLKQVSEVNLPTDNVDLKSGELFRYGIRIDDQGTLHCFNMKWSKKQAAAINLRVVSLNGTPQSYTVTNPSYYAIPFFTFMHEGEYRYVMKFEDQDPKGNALLPSQFYIYAIRNGAMTAISTPFIIDAYYERGLPYYVFEVAADEQGRITQPFPESKWYDGLGATFDIWTLLIKDGEWEGTRMIKRRLGLDAWSPTSEFVIKKNDGAWLLFESRKDRESSRTVVGKAPESYLYKELVTQKGDATEIQETSNMGLMLRLSEQMADGTLLIPAISNGQLNIYKLRI